MIPAGTHASAAAYRRQPWFLRLPQQPAGTHASSATSRHSPDLRRLPIYSRILDPQSRELLCWNRAFLLACLVALFVDPFYFYFHFVGGPACMSVHLGIIITATLIRTITDIFYVANMLLQFRIAFVSSTSVVFGRGEIVRDRRQIAIHYLKGNFIVDLFASIPIPQIIIWFVLPTVSSSSDNQNTNSTLSLIVLLQYFPRLFLIFPLNARIVKANGVVMRTAWAGAAYNLLLYILAGHGLGAVWYLLSMERQNFCWVKECGKENGSTGRPPCNPNFLDCSSVRLPERELWLNSTNVISNCDTSSTSNFKFGMFADALTKKVVGAPFFSKYLYCLWWGLKNLSTFGQNLTTSTYIGETTFVMFISIIGLVLSTLLLGNMQTFLQSISVRFKELGVRKREIKKWMTHRQIPEHMQERVLRFVHYKWVATRGIDEKSILNSLSLDLRREIQRHLYLPLVRRVWFFSQMDVQLLDIICERLLSSFSIKGTYIVREGDPVDEMLFIINGQLESSSTNGGRSGFFDSITLQPDDFCNDELLTWALASNPDGNLPSSTRNIRALTDVEASVLRAEDLKFVANQFKRLHSEKFQYVSRFYSPQSTRWVCLIQAAWRQFMERKQDNAFRSLEVHMQM